MNKIFKLILPVLLLINLAGAKAQAPVACFSASGGQALPITQCGPFFLPLSNCSTVT